MDFVCYVAPTHSPDCFLCHHFGIFTCQKVWSPIEIQKFEQKIAQFCAASIYQMRSYWPKKQLLSRKS